MALKNRVRIHFMHVTGYVVGSAWGYGDSTAVPDGVIMQLDFDRPPTGSGDVTKCFWCSQPDCRAGADITVLSLQRAKDHKAKMRVVNLIVAILAALATCAAVMTGWLVVTAAAYMLALASLVLFCRAATYTGTRNCTCAEGHIVWIEQVE